MVRVFQPPSEPERENGLKQEQSSWEQPQLLGTGVTPERCCDTWHKVPQGAGAVGRALWETLVAVRGDPLPG